MGSTLQSRILVCTACNEEFVFTVEAQEYFLQKGYSEDPQMCKSCYTDNKRNKRNGAAQTHDGAAGNSRKHTSVSRNK